MLMKIGRVEQHEDLLAEEIGRMFGSAYPTSGLNKPHSEMSSFAKLLEWVNDDWVIDDGFAQVRSMSWGA